MDNCIFCSIIERKSPADILYEDDQVMVIQNIYPLAPVHALVIPKKHYTSMNDLAEEDSPLAGHLLMTAKMMAERLGISEQGYRLAINTGRQGGQTVFHLHIHILGGKPLSDSLMTRGVA